MQCVLKHVTQCHHEASFKTNSKSVILISNQRFYILGFKVFANKELTKRNDMTFTHCL